MPLPKARRRGKSLVLKRNTRIDGLLTSVSVEDAFWDGLKNIADVQGIPVNQLVATIDMDRRERQWLNLSSAIRLFVLDYYRQQNGRRAVP
jgi:predicted DNA-binding ribbon-helix-helix protein